MTTRHATLRAGLAALGLLALATPASAAPAGKRPLGKLELKAWDARKDVFFQAVEVWRQGCEIGYRFTFERQKDHPLKLRLLLSLDAGPAQVATPFATSEKAGAQEASGVVATDGCWAKRARTLKRASFEALGDAPRPVAPTDKQFLGKVTFDRWGASGDVFYRHIQTWRQGCRVHYQFLYKRRTASRRRLRMRLSFDNGSLDTPWVRSKERGWREIVGDVPTPGCWAEKASTLRNAAFESERY